MSFLIRDKDDSSKDLQLTMVYKTDGIAKLEYINLIARSPEVAKTFKKAVNALTMNMLNAHASYETILKKQ